jgi:hypothetical protein
MSDGLRRHAGMRYDSASFIADSFATIVAAAVVGVGSWVVSTIIAML